MEPINETFDLEGDLLLMTRDDGCGLRCTGSTGIIQHNSSVFIEVIFILDSIYYLARDLFDEGTRVVAAGICNAIKIIFVRLEDVSGRWFGVHDGWGKAVPSVFCVYEFQWFPRFWMASWTRKVVD
jgi:hypothetical protein